MCDQSLILSAASVCVDRPSARSLKGKGTWQKWLHGLLIWRLTCLMTTLSPCKLVFINQAIDACFILRVFMSSVNATFFIFIVYFFSQKTLSYKTFVHFSFKKPAEFLREKSASWTWNLISLCTNYFLVVLWLLFFFFFTVQLNSSVFILHCQYSKLYLKSNAK